MDVCRPNAFLIVCFCGFPAASVKGLTAEVDGTLNLLSDAFDARLQNITRHHF